MTDVKKEIKEESPEEMKKKYDHCLIEAAELRSKIAHLKREGVSSIPLPMLITSMRIRLLHLVVAYSLFSTLSLVLWTAFPAYSMPLLGLFPYPYFSIKLCLLLSVCFSCFCCALCFAPQRLNCLSHYRLTTGWLRWLHICLWLFSFFLSLLVPLFLSSLFKAHTLSSLSTSLSSMRWSSLSLLFFLTLVSFALYLFALYIYIIIDYLRGNSLLPFTNIVLLIEKGEGADWYLKEMDSIRRYLRHSLTKWHMIYPTKETLLSVIKQIEEMPDCLVIQMCDASVFENLPAERVALALEERGIPFIGGSSRFLQKTLRKIDMKRLFDKYKVSTAEWIESLEDAEEKAKKNPNLFPLFVKTDTGSGSTAITERSVCHNMNELRTEWTRLMNTDNGKRFGLFAEQYIIGPEFTVLVYGSKEGNLSSSSIFSVNAVERRWPDPHGFRTEDEYYIPNYITCVPDPHHQSPLRSLSEQAYVAVGGDSIGRVDIRQDLKTGRYCVLEVNAYPCWGEVDFETLSMAAVLHHADLRAGDIITDIIPKKMGAGSVRVLSEREKRFVQGEHIYGSTFSTSTEMKGQN
eukprot:TRINITY_DN1649_c0_g1_i1.p1 TRINITY_DN1649_c0_g1~~TRINITY_DN1649_c0_g1_i1.p1  ORF type:complete len:575 (+),score=106.12 TRINITY_DN1649_c0_g1_i1:102-1826(+)